MEKRKFRIALDLDGVLADTMQTFCMLLNARRSTHFTVDQFDSWTAWEIAKISKDEFIRTLDEAWFNWKDIPPVEENLSNQVVGLSRVGQVDIVTGRSEATVPYATDWLHSQNIRYNRFVRTESTAAKSYLDYDVFIDDSSSLMQLIASRLFGIGILYQQPWNKTAADLPRIFKVKRWNEILPLLTRHVTEQEPSEARDERERSPPHRG